MNAYKEFELRTKKELRYWFSNSGKEVSLCLISQGFRIKLMARLMSLVGSGFFVIAIVKDLEKKYLK